MTEQDYELLSQYIDGELSDAAALDLRKRLLAEPELRAAYERLRSVDARLRAAFNTAEAEAVPERISAMLRNAPTREEALPGRRRAHWGLAVAASLVAATALLLTPDWRQAPDPAGGNELLAELLENTPSRSQGWDPLPDGREVRPLLSFRSTAGQWCREYLLQDADATLRGVACREQGAWHTEALAAETFVDQGSEYRPAGATQADDVNAWIDANAEDIPLSPDQEAALIARDWQ